MHKFRIACLTGVAAVLVAASVPAIAQEDGFDAPRVHHWDGGDRWDHHHHWDRADAWRRWHRWHRDDGWHRHHWDHRDDEDRGDGM